MKPKKKYTVKPASWGEEVAPQVLNSRGEPMCYCTSNTSAAKISRALNAQDETKHQRKAARRHVPINLTPPTAP